MEKDKFIVITWPEIQDYLDDEGFEDNSLLINDGKLYEIYGDSAFLVRESWYKSIRYKNWKTYDDSHLKSEI